MTSHIQTQELLRDVVMSFQSALLNAHSTICHTASALSGVESIWSFFRQRSHYGENDGDVTFRCSHFMFRTVTVTVSLPCRDLAVAMAVTVTVTVVEGVILVLCERRSG